MQSPLKLLLIEDDRSIASALSYALSTNYTVDAAATGKNGLCRVTTEDYAAIVLDLHLPDMAGLEVCQQLRDRGVNAPILILTGENTVLTKIKLLDAGANDYLTKPFSLGELKARLRTLTRAHNGRADLPQQLVVGDLSLNTVSREVSRSGQALNLRRKEFVLLECLMANAGMVVSRQALLRYAWQGADDPWTNTVDVHIKYLRDKVDRPFDQSLIKTVHGLGYRLEVTSVVGTKECVA